MKKIFLIMLLISMLVLSSAMAYSAGTLNEEGTDQLDVEVEEVEEVESLKILSLEKAVEEGIKNSTQLKTIDLDIKVKQVELSEATYKENKYAKQNISFGTVQGFQLDANMLSKSAEFALEEEGLKKDYIIEDITHNITAGYYGVLQAMDYVNIAEGSLENTKRNRDIADKKFKLGTVSESETLMADIALNEASINVDKAKQDKQKALRSLNMLLNYPLDTELELTSEFKEEIFETNLSKDIESAYETRFDMIRLQNNYDLVKIDFETNAKKYTPNTYQYRYKESTISMVENLLNNHKQNVEFDLRNKYDAIKGAKKQIELSKVNVEKAKEGLRLQEKSYDAGLNTMQEIKEAIVQLYQTELAFFGAVSNYNLTILEYNKAVNLGVIN